MRFDSNKYRSLNAAIGEVQEGVLKDLAREVGGIARETAQKVKNKVKGKGWKTDWQAQNDEDQAASERDAKETVAKQREREAEVKRDREADDKRRSAEKARREREREAEDRERTRKQVERENEEKKNRRWGTDERINY